MNRGKVVLTLLLVLTTLQLVQGATTIPPGATAMIPSEAEFTNAAMQPLIAALQPILTKLSLIVGGLFGLYVILILVRIYYDRKTMRILQDIRYDLDHLNKHYNLPNSRDKLGMWKRLFNFLTSPFRSKSPEEKKSKPK